MSEVLDVYLYGQWVAELERKHAQNYRLRYRDEWATSPEATSLSLSLPLPRRRYDGKVLLDFLDNLLPDSGDVRNRWAREAGLDSNEPFALLREYGLDVAGALQFVPAGVQPNLEGRRAPINAAAIAARIRGLVSDHTSWRGSVGDPGHFSLGGAQGKFALGNAGDGWYEPSGRFPATHIFKPRVRGLIDGEIVEHLTMQLAREAQLNTASTSLEVFEGEHSLAVERFDRAVVGDELVRLHQEDLAQALGVSALQKYQMHRGPGYREILQLMRARVAPERYESSASDFVRALVFSWMVLNTDAHAKNYSMFIRTDGADITPLYDVSSLIPYLGREGEAWSESRLCDAFDRTKLSMRIAADYEAGEQTWFEWEAVALEAGLDPAALREWAVRALEMLPPALAALASTLPSRLQTDVVARYVERMPTRSAQVLRAIGV